jgi:hypothetical protein
LGGTIEGRIGASSRKRFRAARWSPFRNASGGTPDNASDNAVTFPHSRYKTAGTGTQEFCSKPEKTASYVRSRSLMMGTPGSFEGRRRLRHRTDYCKRVAFPTRRYVPGRNVGEAPGNGSAGNGSVAAGRIGPAAPPPRLGSGIRAPASASGCPPRFGLLTPASLRLGFLAVRPFLEWPQPTEWKAER